MSYVCLDVCAHFIAVHQSVSHLCRVQEYSHPLYSAIHGQVYVHIIVIRASFSVNFLTRVHLTRQMMCVTYESKNFERDMTLPNPESNPDLTSQRDCI
jgi:hypothetical protein